MSAEALPAAPATTGPSHRWLTVGAIVAIVALIVLPRFIGLYQTELLLYGLVFAIAALGFNLLLGSTGLLSFGHSAYFGVGAYTVAFVMRDLGFNSMELNILAGIVTSFLVSALFGYVCVRHTRIFFGILTLALSQVLWSLAFKFFWVTGGTDGIRVPRDRLTLVGGLLDFKGAGAYERFVYSYYYYVLVLFVIAVALMWVIVHSPFGQALKAIRDNEVRAGFVGIEVRRYRWFAFLISGVFTGVAGTLWVPLNGLVTPDILIWTFSGEIVFMSVLGGFRTFVGPIVGALVFNYLKVYAVASSEYWQLLLGLVLVVLVMVLPSGIVGVFRQPPVWLRSGAARPVSFLIYYLGLLLVPVLVAVVLRMAAKGHIAGFFTVASIFIVTISWFLLVALTYLRGDLVERRWITALAVLAIMAGPVLALFAPLGNGIWPVLVSILLHLACIVVAVSVRRVQLAARGA